jgi:hypothetical protein
MIYAVDTLPVSISDTAANLATEKFSAGWNGAAPSTASGGDPIVVARVLCSWSGLAGGDGTSKITLDAYTGYNDAAVLDMLTALNISDGAGIAASKDFAVGNQADGSKYLWVCNPAAGSSGGIYLPFGARNKARLINGGTAYTGGSVVLDEIIIYGFRPIFLTNE